MSQFEMPWIQMIKPNVEDLAAGKLVLSQSPEALHLNHNGDMHAAVVFSMLEMAGMGVLTLLLGDSIKDSFVVLKDMHTFFEARAQGKIFFKAELSEQQQAMFINAVQQGVAIEEEISAVAYDESGKQVASAKVNGVIKPKQKNA